MYFLFVVSDLTDTGILPNSTSAMYEAILATTFSGQSKYLIQAALAAYGLVACEVSSRRLKRWEAGQTDLSTKAAEQLKKASSSQAAAIRVVSRGHDNLQ